MAEKKSIKVSEVSFKVSGTAFVLLIAFTVGSCVLFGNRDFSPTAGPVSALLAIIAGGALVVGIVAMIWEA